MYQVTNKVKHLSMKALAFSLFCLLLLSYNLETMAQASASVRYTVVVTEDMLAGRSDDRDDWVQGHRVAGSGDMSAASVTMRVRGSGPGAANGHSLGLEGDHFLVESAVRGSMEESRQPTAEQRAENVITDLLCAEEGDTYLVVMEYN